MNTWIKALDSVSLSDSGIASNISICFIQWLPPPPIWFKINFDGHFQGSKGLEMAVAIARDSDENELGAITKKMKAQCTKEEEAMAAELCIHLALHLDFVDIIIEGDCLNVIESLNGSQKVHWFVLYIIRHVWSLSVLLRSCKYLYVHRSGNNVAHNLAL